jgi:hypothetical protein
VGKKQLARLSLLSSQLSFHLSVLFHSYLLISTCGFLFFLEFDRNNFKPFLAGFNLGLMGFGLLTALYFPVVIGIEEFLVAGVPNAIEDCSCQAVDGEDLAAAVAEVYQDEHSKL